MADTSRDINSFGFRQKEQAATVSQAQVDPSTPAQQKPASEYSIKSLSVVVPKQGLTQNDPFNVEGEVTPGSGKITRPRVLLDAVTEYQDGEDVIKKGLEAQIKDDNTFRATFPALRYNDGYLNDDDKADDATFTFTIVANGSTAEKELRSSPLSLPTDPAGNLPLQNGDYDDTANGQDADTYPDDGDTYKEGTPVTDLQTSLIKLRYLKDGSADGVFGAHTERMLKEFQSDSLKKLRLDEKTRKLVEAPSVSYEGSSDGIYGAKTQKEIQKWSAEHWLRPIVELRQNDYDAEAVRQKQMTAGGDDYHEVAKPVLEAQKLLSQLGAYTGALDGWFGDKMKESVKLFQDAAARGAFLLNGQKKVYDEKLIGHAQGVHDQPTQEYAKKRGDEGAKIPADEYGYPGGTQGSVSLSETQDTALTITEDFEGGQGPRNLTGNSDGQGISWGIMQWNYGQGTLAPLLLKMRAKNASAFEGVFNGNSDDRAKFVEVATEYATSKQVEWACTIQSATFAIDSKWKGYFNGLTLVGDFVQIQRAEAISQNHSLTARKIEWLRDQHPSLFRKVSLRGYVALFDLSNQQGALGSDIMNMLQEYWSANKPSCQFEVVSKVCYEKGLSSSAKGGEYRSDCISRRMGILHAKSFRVGQDPEKGIIVAAERQSSHFGMLSPNRVIEDL